MSVRIALYQPDIPQNTGTILRLAACLDLKVAIVHPAAFDMSDRALRRAKLDYEVSDPIEHHDTYDALKRECRAIGSRLILLTTKGDTPHHAFSFAPGDTLMAGRESAGVPDEVHTTVDHRVYIPMRQGVRSLNVAVAMALVLGEALKQTGGFSRFA
jgi:tRNA (cytidine/uridine-2'-O-)-methyltransferase